MIDQWIKSGAYKKIGENIANKRLAKLLEYIERGEAVKDKE